MAGSSASRHRGGFDINYGFVDIVADRFDAGVRFGGAVDKAMTATRRCPVRMAAVASPSYFAKHPAPKTPRDPVHHRCINIGFPTYGGVYAWEFERRGGKLNIHVDGTLVFSAPTHMAAVALGGLGIAYLPEVEFAPHLNKDT